MKPHDPNEIIAVVNENDKVISQDKRITVHQKGLLHREVYVYLIFDNKVCLQLRQDSRLLDHSCAGHFPVTQSYEEAAIRELQEELGIKATEKELLFIAKKKFMTQKDDYANNRFAKIFIIERKPDFCLDKSEVKSVKMYDLAMLNRLIKHKEKITPSSEEIIKKHILPILSERRGAH